MNLVLPRRGLCVWGGLLLLSGIFSPHLRADNYLKNAGLKEGFACWHGDGDATYLKPDGTEGAEFDPGAVPVIKMSLSGSPHTVYQEFDMTGRPASMRVRVDVYASRDFKRSKFADDYTPGIDWTANSVWYWWEIIIPKVDFWIRAMPGWSYKTAYLKPGKWVTIGAHFDGGQTADEGAINFCIPAGEGVIYLKNPIVSP